MKFSYSFNENKTNLRVHLKWAVSLVIPQWNLDPNVSNCHHKDKIEFNLGSLLHPNPSTQKIAREVMYFESQHWKEGKENISPKSGNSKLALTLIYNLNVYYLGGYKTSSKEISFWWAQADGGTGDWWKQMKSSLEKSTLNTGLK